MPKDRITRQRRGKNASNGYARRFPRPRYVVEDLDTFKTIIMGLRESALKELEELQTGAPPFAHGGQEQLTFPQTELVEQLNAALARIKEREYGCCEQCGIPIDKMRLMAVPHTRRCFACNGAVKPGVHRFHSN